MDNGNFEIISISKINIHSGLSKHKMLFGDFLNSEKGRFHPEFTN